MTGSRGHGKGQLGRQLALGIALTAGLGVSAAAATAGFIWFQQSQQPCPVTLEELASYFDAEGRIRRFDQLLGRVAAHGIDASCREVLWPFLLGVYEPHHTRAERESIMDDLREHFRALMVQAQATAAEAARLADAGDEETSLEVAQFEEAQGIIVLDSLRQYMGDYRGAHTDQVQLASTPSGSGNFVAGLCSAIGLPVAPESALTPPGLQQPGSRSLDAGEGSSGKEQRPVADEDSWLSAAAREAIDGAEHLTPMGRDVTRRLVRLLTAYALKDPVIGYCQGMADLALIFVLHCVDDALAFELFRRLMAVARDGFRIDEHGYMKTLLAISGSLEVTDPVLYHKLCQVGSRDCMFAFRLAILLLRRELPTPDVASLWEVVWAEDLAAARRDKREVPGAAGAAAAAGPAAEATPRNGRAQSPQLAHATSRVAELTSRASLSSAIRSAAASARQSIEFNPRTPATLLRRSHRPAPWEAGEFASQLSGTAGSDSVVRRLAGVPPRAPTAGGRQGAAGGYGSPTPPEPGAAAGGSPPLRRSRPPSVASSVGGSDVPRGVGEDAGVSRSRPVEPAGPAGGAGGGTAAAERDREGFGGGEAQPSHRSQISAEGHEDWELEAERYLMSGSLMLFALVAVVRQNRRKILDECRSADDVNQLFATSGAIRPTVWQVVSQAKQLRQRFLQETRAWDRRETS